MSEANGVSQTYQPNKSQKLIRLNIREFEDV